MGRGHGAGFFWIGLSTLLAVAGCGRGGGDNPTADLNTTPAAAPVTSYALRGLRTGIDTALTNRNNGSGPTTVWTSDSTGAYARINFPGAGDGVVGLQWSFPDTTPPGPQG